LEQCFFVTRRESLKESLKEGKDIDKEGGLGLAETIALLNLLFILLYYTPHQPITKER
jgi:hypothetical protein